MEKKKDHIAKKIGIRRRGGKKSSKRERDGGKEGPKRNCGLTEDLGKPQIIEENR